MLFFLSLEKSAQFEAPAGNQTHLLAWPPAGSFLSFRLAEGDVIRTLRNSFFQWDSEASFVWTARPTVPQWGDTGWPRHSVVGRLPPLSMISENIPIGHAAQGPPVWHPVTGMCLFHFHKFTQTNIITNTFFPPLTPTLAYLARAGCTAWTAEPWESVSVALHRLAASPVGLCWSPWRRCPLSNLLLLL